MAGTRRAQRSPERDRPRVRAAWRLLACVPLVLLVIGLGVRAGLEADWNDDDARPAASAQERGDRQPAKSTEGAKVQRIGSTNTTLRRTFAAKGKLTPREAKARCEKSGIDPADLASMTECIADLTT